MTTADMKQRQGRRTSQQTVNGRRTNGASPGSSEINWLAALLIRVPARWWPALLRISDMILILVAFVMAYWVRYRLQWFLTVDPANQADLVTYLPFALALVFLLFCSFQFSRVYVYRRDRTWLEEVYAIASATTIGVVVLIILNLAFGQLSFSRLIFLYTAVLVALLLGISRAVIYTVRGYLRNRGVGLEHVVLVGVGEVGLMVMRTIAARPSLGYKLVGFLDDDPAVNQTDIGRFQALGPLNNFFDILQNQDIDTAIICLPWRSHRTVARLLDLCEQNGTKAQIVPDFFQLTKNQMQMEQLSGIPLITTRAVSIAGWNLFVKRALDVALATAMLVVGLPLGALIALAVRFNSPGPVIYAQTRVGRSGRPFKIFKFRSMTADADAQRDEMADLNEASGPLFKMRDDPRRTPVGRILRRLSLDELPNLVNVLRGEMSLVGPRPNTPEEVSQYKDWHRKRLSVSPGMTGLWQVSGRSDLTFDEMVLLDIYYAENWSLALDLGIMLRTVPKVLGGEGAY